MNETGYTVRVAVKAAIVHQQRVLVLYKSNHGVKGDPDPSHRHDLPGGRLEVGESPQDGLAREVLEETGLQVEIMSPAHVWHYFEPAHRFQLVGIVFACNYLSGEVRLSDEHSRYEWLTHDQIARQGWPDAEDYLAALRVLTAASNPRVGI